MEALPYVNKKNKRKKKKKWVDILQNLISGRKGTYDERVRRVRTTIVELEKQ
jgi:hypothetical protein